MIDYDFLCQAITDWRDGKRPDAPFPPSAPINVGVVEELDASVAVEEPEYDYESAPQDTSSVAYQPPIADYDQATDGQPGAEYPGLSEPAAVEVPVADGIDRTLAYVPGDYDPAGVAAQDVDEDVEVVEDEEDIDVDDDDDFERDYDLEAIDDAANFDFLTDLTQYFVAEFRIQEAWDDSTQRRNFFAEYGIRDEQHFYQVTATLERFLVSDAAEERYGGLDAIMQLKLNATSDLQLQRQQDLAQGELAGELEPFEGVSLQAWAQAQAGIASGGDVAEALAALGIDQPAWDRASTEWNARMSRDTTTTIATEYGKAFAGAGQGQFGAAGAAGAAGLTPGGDAQGDPPVSIERWVEVEVAQACGVEQGRDPAEILASFGMTIVDWSNVGAWWGTYFNRHAMENDQALYHRYNQLRDHYQAHYGSAPADDES